MHEMKMSSLKARVVANVGRQVATLKAAIVGRSFLGVIVGSEL